MFDAQGNTRKVTADNQAVSGTFAYDAFGTVTYSSGSPRLRNRYCGNWGYRDDGDTFASLSASAGLLHVGARYYDPTTGRFTTRDTLLTEHPYVYCDGDPVNAVDPDGQRRSFLQWCKDQWSGLVDIAWNVIDWTSDLMGPAGVGLGALAAARTQKQLEQRVKEVTAPKFDPTRYDESDRQFWEDTLGEYSGLFGGYGRKLRGAP